MIRSRKPPPRVAKGDIGHLGLSWDLPKLMSGLGMMENQMNYPKDLDIGVKNSIIRENSVALDELIQSPTTAYAVEDMVGKGSYKFLMKIYPTMTPEGKLNLYHKLENIIEKYKVKRQEAESQFIQTKKQKGEF